MKLVNQEEVKNYILRLIEKNGLISVIIQDRNNFREEMR